MEKLILEEYKDEVSDRNKRGSINSYVKYHKNSCLTFGRNTKGVHDDNKVEVT